MSQWTANTYAVTVRDSLPAGDTIVLTYGDRRAGGPGIRMTLAALRQWFRILHVPQDGIGAREVIAEPPYVDLLPAPPAQLDVLAPSRVRRGEAIYPRRQSGGRTRQYCRVAGSTRDDFFGERG